MNRRSFLQTAGYGAVSHRNVAGASARSNIIFFMVDQLSAKWLEGDSARSISTPALDRLRAAGVTFTRAIASNPICSPSRATLATGLSSRGHGVLQNGYLLENSVATFMQLLQRAGWRTGSFGKLHLRPHYMGLHQDWRPYGFDVVRNTEDPRAGEWLDWVEREQPEHYTAALATVRDPDIPELASYGPARLDLREKIKTLVKQFAWATKEFPENNSLHYTLPFPEPVSQTAWITAHATQFIRDTEASRPLYAHVSYVQPHPPYCAPAECMGLVDTDRIPTPAPIEWLDSPLAPPWFRTDGRSRMRIPQDWRSVRQYYFADLIHLDRQLALLFDVLERTGRLGNTYLVFVADHGDMFFDHGFQDKGSIHYDACVRVPLIIAGPGVRHGHSCAELVQLEDIFPTVMEMAGLDLPAPRVFVQRARESGYPGRSLLPLCGAGNTPGWRDAAYIESYNNRLSSSYREWARTVRTAQWRYTMYPGGPWEQLFCLRNDPDEQKNLATDPGYAAVRREMRERLLEMIILQDYPHPPRSRYALGAH